MTLHDLTATEQARLIRERALSPVELVDHYLDRIDRHSATVGAFVTVVAESARHRARDVALQLAQGADTAPFAGVPIGVKDLTLTAGITTTFGSAALADHVPSVDAAVVTRMRRAGFVIVGKTSTPEFGATCYTEPATAPPARTPWDLSRSASGSSGGAAAAVAAGLLPVAPGTDGGGSVRTPAANCGLVGFKPSRGVVGPAPGPDILGTSTDGVLARTVEDGAALLDVIAGVEIGDRFGAAHDGPPVRNSPRTRVGRLRIARCLDPGNGAPVDSTVAAAVDTATTLLEGLGHEIEDVAHPMGDAYVEIQDDLTTLFAVGVSASALTLVAEHRRRLLRPYTRWLLDVGAETTGPEYLLSLQRMFRAATVALNNLAPYDALLTPTTTAPAEPVGALRNDDHPEREPQAMIAWSAYTPPYNLTGQPAVSLPVSWTPDGVPVGVQLVGRVGGDAALLALAAQLEVAAGWNDRHPPLWEK